MAGKGNGQKARGTWRKLILSAVLSGVLAAPLMAQDAAAESSAEAKQAFVTAANFQNNQSYDLAISEWESFLKAFPKDPLAAKAGYYLGICQLQEKQFDKAAASFQAVITNYPKFESLEDAWLNLASSQYSLAVSGKPEFFASAAQNYGTLVKSFPQSKHLDEALFYQGESFYSLGKRAEAAAAYSALITTAGLEKSARRADAMYALGVAQEELSQFAPAGTTYDLFLKEFPQNKLVTEVKMRKAETVLQAGAFPQAATMFAEVAAVPNFASADAALMRQAFCEAKQDKFAEAAATYAKVATTFPQSTLAAEASLSAGRWFYRGEKWDDATAWLSKAIAAGGNGGAEASHWLARVQLKQKKFAEAAATAAKGLTLAPTSPFAANLKIDTADALYEIPERRAEAMTAYQQFAAADPKHELASQALYNAAFAAMELKNYDEGLKSTAAFLTTYPQDKLLADVKYVAAECNLQLKKYPEAEALFKDLTTAYPQHADVDAWRVRQGLTAFLQKKYPETVAILGASLASLKSPDAIAETQFLIGSSHFYTDKAAEAEAALTASLAANPKWRQADEAMLVLSRSQRKLNKNAEAKALLTKIGTDFPASTLSDQVQYRLGEVCFALDDFAGAVAAYDKVATINAASQFVPFAVYGKGWALMRSKDFAGAATQFTEVITKFPQHSLVNDALFARASARRQTSDFKGASEDLAKVVTTLPAGEKQSDAYYELGLAQVGLQDFAGAVGTFEKLLTTDTKYSGTDKVLYELAWANKSQNKGPEAIAYFARLAKDFASSNLATEALFHVGEDLYEKKNYVEAAKQYQAAVAKQPTGELREKSEYKLGWSHFQQKQYDEALKAFTAQVTTSPQGGLVADGKFMQAECLFRLAKYAEALAIYKPLVGVKASTPAIEVLTLLHAGQSASQLKQWQEAITLLATIPTKAADTPLMPEVMYELGWAKQNLGKADEAMKDYEQAATKSRDQVGARARFMLGELYFEKKQHNDAIREFQRAMFGYGVEGATPETKNWQAKAGYEAGRCAEVQVAAVQEAAAKKKMVADAIRFYTFVVEKHPQHELVAEAKKRLEELAKLK